MKNIGPGLEKSRTALLNSTEAVTGGVLWQKVFLEILQNSQENTCARVSFLIKLGPGTGVFLWILQNFKKHLFCRTLRDGFFRTRVNFMIYWTWLGLKKYLTTLLNSDLDLFYDLLDLNLENTLTNLLDQTDFVITKQGCSWKILKNYLNYLLNS